MQTVSQKYIIKCVPLRFDVLASCGSQTKPGAVGKKPHKPGESMQIATNVRILFCITDVI